MSKMIKYTHPEWDNALILHPEEPAIDIIKYLNGDDFDMSFLSKTEIEMNQSDMIILVNGMDKTANYKKFLDQIKDDPEIIWIAQKEQEQEIMELRDAIHKEDAIKTIKINSLSFRQAVKWIFIHEKRRHQQDIDGINKDLEALADVELPKDVEELAGNVRFEI